VNYPGIAEKPRQDPVEILQQVYSPEDLDRVVLPYSSVLLERLRFIFNYHAGCFQNLLLFSHNNFEIHAWLEKFSESPPGTIEQLSAGEFERAVVQFLAIYEMCRSQGFHFVDFRLFQFQPSTGPRFALALTGPGLPPVDEILAIFRGNPHYKNLPGHNADDCLTTLSRHHKFPETQSYAYRFDEFATAIIPSFPLGRQETNTAIKIKIKTVNPVQKRIIKLQLSHSFFSEGVFTLLIDNREDNLFGFFSTLLLGRNRPQPGDFAALGRAFEEYLGRSAARSAAILIDNLKTREDGELIKYLLDSFILPQIVLIVFDSSDPIDFDLELKERAENLLGHYLRFYDLEENRELSTGEIYLLKVFSVLQSPVPVGRVKEIFPAEEQYIIDCLIKKKYLKLQASNISLAVSPGSLDIRPTRAEEQEILRLFLDKFDSINRMIQYMIDAGKTQPLGKILSRYLHNRYKNEDSRLSIKKLFFNNLDFLGKEIDLIRLFVDILIKENDLLSAREIIACCRHQDPATLDLKLAHIYKLEKDYQEMGRLLDQCRDQVEKELEDELYYLEFIYHEKISGFAAADRYLERIKGALYRHLAHIQFSDRYIYRGEHDRAEAMILETISYLGGQKFFRDELEAKTQLAKLSWKRGDFEAASAVYKNIFIQSEINDYKLLSAHIAIDFGNLYLAGDDFTRAESWYKKAQKIYREQENENGRILAQSNLAEIFQVKGAWQETENYLKAALEYDRERNKLDALAIDYFNIAFLEYLRHNPSKAQEYLSFALSLFEKKENRLGYVESWFLKLKISLWLGKKKLVADFAALEKYAGIFSPDQEILFSLLEVYARESSTTRDFSSRQKIEEIQSSTLRFETLCLAIRKHRDPGLLDCLRHLAMQLSPNTRNYYYYEFYYTYFNHFATAADFKGEQKEIFFDIYYFFLRNKRRLSSRINQIKNDLDEKDSSYDVFRSAELVGDYNQWKIPGDFFKSLLKEFGRSVHFDLVKLVIYERGQPLFTFAHLDRYPQLTDELISTCISTLDDLNLDLPGLRALCRSEEKVFYSFPVTQVFRWKISDTLLGVLLLAFNQPGYYDYNFSERHRDLLKKFASLIQRYYERDFRLNQKLHFLIGESLAMQKIKEQILKVSKVDFSLLITGESGSGKELIAKGVHLVGNRAEKPFVAVNSAAIPENLLEAELFGYRKGAFTGANEDRIGLIEAAHEGTLFLDEIADLPFNLQAKLLRVLQENEIRRLGENKTRKVDFRLLSATNKDLKQLVMDHRFREDLYFRIQDLTIAIPPLRDRLEDISLLAEHFFSKNNFPIQDKPEFQGIVEYLSTQEWKGNVRELESSIKRLITYYPDFEMGEQFDLAREFSLKKAKENLEKALILKTLRENDWNKVKTARILKISRMYLFNLINKYRLTS